MSYMKRLAERLDEIIADPRTPHDELRERLQRFLMDEVRRSYWTGVKFGSEGRAKPMAPRQHEDEEVMVSRL